MTEYCPYIKYRRRPAVVPRLPSGRLGCGGRPPPTFAPPPARCRRVAANRRSSLGVWPRRPRRQRRGRSSARLPGRGLVAARGLLWYSARPRSPRPSLCAAGAFRLPCAAAAACEACLASAAGRRLRRRARLRFAVSSAGGRRSALPPPLAVLAPPSARKPLRPSGRRLCRRACAPLRRSLRSPRPSGSLWVGSARRCRSLASALGVASVARARRGEPPFSRGSPLAALALALRAPLPAAAGCGGCLVGRAPPCAPPKRRRLFWRFRRAAFSAGDARGDAEDACAAAAGAEVGGSVRPPTSTGHCSAHFPLSLKGKKSPAAADTPTRQNHKAI